jgi:hypothetical protein
MLAPTADLRRSEQAGCRQTRRDREKQSSDLPVEARQALTGATRRDDGRRSGSGFAWLGQKARDHAAEVGAIEWPFSEALAVATSK